MLQFQRSSTGLIPWYFRAGLTLAWSQGELQHRSTFPDVFVHQVGFQAAEKFGSRHRLLDFRQQSLMGLRCVEELALDPNLLRGMQGI